MANIFSRDASGRRPVERWLWRWVAWYFVLYAPAVLSSFGFGDLPQSWYEALWQGPVRALATAFGVKLAKVELTQPTSETFQIFEVVLFALLATIIAAVWQRLKPAIDDRRLTIWTKIGFRYLLACAAFHYGMIQLFRFQFTKLSLELLVTPVGELRRHEMLWAWLGWSSKFTTFLGICNLAGGLLFLRRRTSLFGAIFFGVILSNVAILNFTFDVPGKTIAPNLVLVLTLFLLPELDRLRRLHLSGERVPAADLGEDIPQSGWIGRYRKGIKAVAVAVMMISPVALIYRVRGSLNEPDEGTLYKVRYLTENGDPRPMVPADSLNWRRIITGSGGSSSMHVQLLSKSWVEYRVTTGWGKEQKWMISAPKPSSWRDRPKSEAARYVPGADYWDMQWPVPNVMDSTRDTLLVKQRDSSNVFDVTGTIGGARVKMQFTKLPRDSMPFFHGRAALGGQ